MRKAYIIRHGEPAFPGGVWRCIGSRTDLPLSERGREQAKNLAPCFVSGELASLWASPLRRAWETAELLSGGRWRVNIHPGLTEISVGAWEGLTREEARSRYPERWAERERDMSLPPTDGEPYGDAAVRFEKALGEIMDHTDGNIAVVAHMAVVSAFFCLVTGKSIGEWPDFGLDYASVSVLTYENGVFRLLSYGRIPDEGGRLIP